MGTFKLALFASIVSFTNFQTITLYDFKQEDSKSKCTNGILLDTDIIVFKCTVDYSDDTEAKHVIFQTKGITDNRFVFLSDCDIQDDCKSSKNIEGIHVDRYIISMTINVEARKAFRHAQLRGKLIKSDGKEIISNKRMIPYISDVLDVNGTLIVNGNTIPITQVCKQYIPGAELNIVFLCESQVSPCLIEISTDDSNETTQGLGYATWNKEYHYQTEVNILIKYAVCNLKGKCKSLSCKFHIDNKSSTKGMSYNDNVIPWAIVSSLAMILTTLLLLFKLKKKISRLFAKRWSKDTVSLKHNRCCTDANDSEERINLQEKHEQDDNRQKDTSVDSEMDTVSPLSHSKSTKKRHNDKFEVEACSASEPQDLKTDFTSCQKSKKHDSFIHIDKFSKNDLPLMLCTSELFDLIKYIAELTVKVIVDCISYQRPAFYPGTDHYYPFHEKRGTYNLRFGTGLIKRVIRTEIGQTCPCNKCLHSGNASKVWGKIFIATSKSLVFDDNEAQKTTFKITFNEENKLYHHVEGVRVTQSDIHNDNCDVECVTCDEGLLNLLYLKPNKCMQKMAYVNSKYNKFKENENLTIIVSHPHGCPKHVSIGNWIKRLVVGNDGSRQYTQYVYTTPTCPGCIGAFVYILGASDISLTHHMHCGVNEEMNNFSRIGMEKNCN